MQVQPRMGPAHHLGSSLESTSARDIKPLRWTPTLHPHHSVETENANGLQEGGIGTQSMGGEPALPMASQRTD